MSHELLLDDDGLRALGAIIDYNRDYVAIGGQMLPCRPSSRSDIRIAMTELKEWVLLRPNVFTVDGVPNGRVPTTAMKIDTGDHPPI